MTAVSRKPASADDAHAARWKTLLLPRRARGFGWVEGSLLLLPALAVIHLLSPAGASEIELLLLALLAACLLAWATGALRRLWRLHPGAGSGREIAPHLRIVSAKGVLIAARGMLEQAVADGRPLSIAVLELHDLPELHKLFGGSMATRVLTRVSKRLRAVAGAKGLAMRTSRTQFTLVLPGLDANAVRLALHTVFGAACCVEEDVAEEIVMLPDFDVETLTRDGPSIAQSYDRLCDNLAARQRRGRRAPPAAPRQAEPEFELRLEPEFELELQPAAVAEQPIVPVGYVPTVPLPLR